MEGNGVFKVSKTSNKNKVSANKNFLHCVLSLDMVRCYIETFSYNYILDIGHSPHCSTLAHPIPTNPFVP